MIEHKGEIRILKALLQTDGMSLSALQKRTKLSWQDLKKFLAKLENEGLILQSVYSVVTIVNLNKTSPKYQAIQTLWGKETNV